MGPESTVGVPGVGFRQALGAALGPSSSKVASLAFAYLSDQSKQISDLMAASARKDQAIDALKDERHDLKTKVAMLQYENATYRRTTNASRIFIITGTGLLSAVAWPLLEQKQYFFAFITGAAALGLIGVGWFTRPPEEAQK